MKILALAVLVLSLACVCPGQQCGMQCPPPPTPTPTPIPQPVLIPFPAIPPVGGTVTLEPGDYSCPPSIPTNTQIIGHGALLDSGIFTMGQPVYEVGAINAVKVHCNSSLILRSVTNVQIGGVIFDFGLNPGAGLVIDGVTFSRFDAAVYNTTGPGWTLQTTDGQIVGNNFDHLVCWNCYQGVLARGSGSFAITWNMFHDVQILKSTDYGIGIEQNFDTNIFDSVRVAFLPVTARAGVIINTNATVNDYDTGGNIFTALMVDSINWSSPNLQTYSLILNGFTQGNYVRMTFGLMPEARKVLIQPGLYHSDTIDRLTEHAN